MGEKKNKTKCSKKWYSSNYHDGFDYIGPFDTKDEAIEAAAESFWPDEGFVYVGIGVKHLPSSFLYIEAEDILE